MLLSVRLFQKCAILKNIPTSYNPYINYFKDSTYWRIIEEDDNIVNSCRPIVLIIWNTWTDKWRKVIITNHLAICRAIHRYEQYDNLVLVQLVLVVNSRHIHTNEISAKSSLSKLRGGVIKTWACSCTKHIVNHSLRTIARERLSTHFFVFILGCLSGCTRQIIDPDKISITSVLV